MPAEPPLGLDPDVKPQTFQKIYCFQPTIGISVGSKWKPLRIERHIGKSPSPATKKSRFALYIHVDITCRSSTSMSS